MTNTKQAKTQSKAICKWVRQKSVFATRKLAGFAAQAIFLDSSQSQTRDAFGSQYLGNLKNDIGFGYCGKVYDVGTGLYDYGFRDYSPVAAEENLNQIALSHKLSSFAKQNLQGLPYKLCL